MLLLKAIGQILKPYSYAGSENYEKQLLALSCLSGRPSICMEQQLGFHWTDFHEIL
jgi:hypothetical protein